MQKGPGAKVSGWVTACVCLAVSAWAQSDSPIAGRGEATAPNRTPLYISAKISSRDAISTTRELPDSPGAIAGKDENDAAPPRRQRSNDHTPSPAAKDLRFSVDSHVADKSYWTMTGLMFSSSIADAELTVRCVGEGKCVQRLRNVPANRPQVYGIGIPGNVGIAYLTYYLKRKHSRFWSVPAAVVTVGNTYFAIRSAYWMSK